MSRKRSPVWQYFDHTEGGKKCKICDKTVLCDGNTSNLFSHLKFNHAEEHAKLNHRDGKSSTQLKISDVLGDYNLLNGKDFWDKIDQLISWWVIKNNQPFRVVDNPEFRAILYALNKKYNPPHRKRLVNLIRDLYNIKKDQVKDFFGNIKWFCLTTDSWKDIKNQRSYIAITVHFIHDYLPGSICISASQITAISATATVLKEIIMNTLAEWNLDIDKLVAIVTDGGTNFVAAAKAISKHIHCVAHRLNLVVNDTLSSCKDIIGIISKVRSIVTSFKKSSNLMAELMAEQDKEGMEQIKVKQDIETRWNSEYMMIERYLQLSVQISNVLRKNCMRNIDLNDDEISLLSDVASLLKPVYEMTNDLSGDKYITISRVIPILFLVRNKILKTRIQHYDAKSMQTKLIVNLDTRLMNVEDSCLFAFPTLLDPRFKKIAFTSTSACSNRITELSTLISDVPTTQQPPHEVDDSDLWSLLDKRVNQISNPLSGATNGLKHFVEADCLPRDADPLEFWKNNKNNWPQLHNIFLKYAVVQPTSVPSERVFSKTGLIITDQRNKIKPENVDMLCFLESLPNVFH